MKKLISLVLAVFLIMSMFAACSSNGGSSAGGDNEVVLWYVGGAQEAAVINELKTAFDAAFASQGITLKPIMKDSYSAILDGFSYGYDLPDITYIDDEYFKRMAKHDFIAPIDDLIQNVGLDTSGFWPTAISRYTWNKDTNTSNPGDPLYCLPKDINPTVLFYNVDALASVGITVISVDVADLEAFYEGTKADATGKMIDAYPALAAFKGSYDKLFERGFWWETESNGYPSNSGAMVFNNKVAMSWDELEMFSKALTKSYNANSPTTYGFYSEWWFNYGWSVGGDCLGDADGNGSYEFTLNDANPNYKVLKNVTINGHDYNVSDEDMVFVSYADKKYLAENPSVVESLGGSIQEFPSTLEAFGRFCMLTRPSGYTETCNGLTFEGTGVTPLCKEVTNAEQATTQFGAGTLGSYIGYANSSYDISKNINWDFAPVPVYKEYDADNNVVAIGRAASQSKTTGFAISAASTKKDLAAQALKWLVTDGQAVMAEGGYNIPNSLDNANQYFLSQVDSNKNWATVVQGATTQDAGDWWYMEDRNWIANWSQPLNQASGSVRNNGMTLNQYFEKVVEITNTALKGYQ